MSHRLGRPAGPVLDPHLPVRLDSRQHQARL